jgi:acetyl-CoA carboxylase biotin carboxyl carrier protein
MGESNGNRQAGQGQSVQKSGSEGNGRKVNSDKTGIKEIDDILSAYDFMVSEGLSDLDFNSGDARYVIKRGGVKTAVCTEEKAVIPVLDEFRNAVSITSPLSGVYYSSAKPGMPPFVSVNDVIEKGSTLCIIEAMKVMNEIKADSKYKIVKIFAVNGKAVSAGEVLCLVKML